MSLHFDLKVNGEDVGKFFAARIASDGNYGCGPDDVNSYLVQVGSENDYREFRVAHRYGDGAWGLVVAAMRQLSTPDLWPMPKATAEDLVDGTQRVWQRVPDGGES